MDKIPSIAPTVLRDSRRFIHINDLANSSKDTHLKLRSGIDIVKNTHAKIKLREEKKLLEQVHLPLWPDDQRAVPNGILRSALFGAIRPGKRRYIDGVLNCTQN